MMNEALQQIVNDPAFGAFALYMVLFVVCSVLVYFAMQGLTRDWREDMARRTKALDERRKDIGRRERNLQKREKNRKEAT